MKKRWKIFWITCAISGITGIVFLMISLTMGVSFQKIDSMMPYGISIGDFDDMTSSDISVDVEDGKIPNDDSYQKNSQNTYDGIHSLDIELMAGEVEILTSKSDKVKIMTENISKKLKLSYHAEGDTLVVESADELKNIVNQNLGTIYIYLPAEIQLERAKISIGAGTLYIEDIVANDFSVEVGAGEAIINSFTSYEADFDCGAGEMRISGITGEELEINCGIGNVNYKTYDSEDNYNYKISCGVGEITCGTKHYSGIGSEQKIDHHHAFKEMDIDCGLGNVEIIFEGGH